MRFTIYSKPRCVQCDATQGQLRKLAAEFDVADLTETPEALEYVTEDLGYAGAFVVMVEDGTEQNHWSGFRPT